MSSHAAAGPIHVSVKLYGVLRRYRPAGGGGEPHQPFSLELPAGATVADLAGRLAIADGLVSAAAINGVAAEPDAILTDGDDVRLFPPAAGG